MEDLGKNLTEQMQRNNWNERYQKLITEILQDTEVRTFLAENSQRNHSLFEIKPRYIGTITNKQHLHSVSSSSLLLKEI